MSREAEPRRGTRDLAFVLVLARMPAARCDQQLNGVVVREHRLAARGNGASRFPCRAFAPDSRNPRAAKLTNALQAGLVRAVPTGQRPAHGAGWEPSPLGARAPTPLRHPDQ